MRADKFFAERFGSRTKAKEALIAGYVTKNGKLVAPDDEIFSDEGYTISKEIDFVSNGGRKLERALNVFSIDVSGKTFADLGASTGGFTDCLLKKNAKRVYCVDVGESQLDRRIVTDRRVTVMDKTNARYLTPAHFPEKLDGVVSDLSFISLRLVLPAVNALLPDHGQAFVLFKPQYECGGKGLGKSGILPKIYHKNLLSGFYSFCITLNLAPVDVVCAPIFPKKNIEYVVYLQKNGTPISEQTFLAHAQIFS